MSKQSSEYSGHDSGSLMETDQNSVNWEAKEEPEDDRPRRKLPPLLVVQPDQPVTHQRPQSDLKNRLASLWSRRWPRPETESPDIKDDASHLWSLAEFHLKAIDDAYKLENWKLSAELERTQQQLREQAAKMVSQRSGEINGYMDYVYAIYHRMEDDGGTIRSLREKLKAVGIKNEDWKDIDELLVDLEESHAQSSDDIIRVAFEFQQDIDKGERDM